MISLNVSYLEFTQLHEPVGLWLSPIERVFHLYFFDYFLRPILFLLSFWDSVTQTLDFLLQSVLQILKSLFIFFIYFVIYINFYLPLNSVILFSLISILLLSPGSDFFPNFQLHFSVLKYHSVLCIFYFFAEVIICFKSIHKCLKHFYDNCLKILIR